MASTWGDSWASAWGDSWDLAEVPAPPAGEGAGGGGGRARSRAGSWTLLVSPRVPPSLDDADAVPIEALAKMLQLAAGAAAPKLKRHNFAGEYRQIFAERARADARRQFIRRENRHALLLLGFDAEIVSTQ